MPNTLNLAAPESDAEQEKKNPPPNYSKREEKVRKKKIRELRGTLRSE